MLPPGGSAWIQVVESQTVSVGILPVFAQIVNEGKCIKVIMFPDNKHRLNSEKGNEGIWESERNTVRN